MKTDSDTAKAYRAARAQRRDARNAHGFTEPQWGGAQRPLAPHEIESRRSRFPLDGVGHAVAALAKARDNLAKVAAACMYLLRSSRVQVEANARGLCS